MGEHGLSSRMWRKSSYSGADGGCVEVAGKLLGSIAVRDSKDAAGPELAFASTEWKSFTSQLKDNEYDLT